MQQRVKEVHGLREASIHSAGQEIPCLYHVRNLPTIGSYAL